MNEFKCLFCEKEPEYYGVHAHNFGAWVCKEHTNDFDIIKSSLTHIDDLNKDWLESMGIKDKGRENGVSYGYSPAITIDPKKKELKKNEFK